MGIVCFCLLWTVAFGRKFGPYQHSDPLEIVKYCGGAPNANAPANDNPILDANPILVNKIENGELYTVGSGDDQMWMAHIYGSAYDLGYAHGTLLKSQVNAFVSGVWDFILDEIPLHEIFPELENATIAEALDLTAQLTAPYTPDYWFEELRGLADGSGTPYKELLRLHMLPELTRGACTMFGAWGTATTDGNLVQLRALDWETTGPFNDYPALIVYHPTDGHSFANLGWTGWMGSITGVSINRVSISEIGVSCPDDSFGREGPASRAGYPFPFVLRDILQFDNSVENATHRFETTHRTCNLILGVGDGREDMFRGYEYSHTVLNVFDDNNMMPYNETWHPRMGMVSLFFSLSFFHSSYFRRECGLLGYGLVMSWL